VHLPLLVGPDVDVRELPPPSGGGRPGLHLAFVGADRKLGTRWTLKGPDRCGRVKPGVGDQQDSESRSVAGAPDRALGSASSGWEPQQAPGN
jgi:hypothetical protein